MVYEQHAAEAAGLPWDTHIFVPPSEGQMGKLGSEDRRVVQPILVSGDCAANPSWVGFRCAFHRWLRAQQTQYDALVVRYSCYDPVQYWQLRKIHRPVFLVHHTMEVSELALEKGLRRLKAPVEALIGRFTLPLAAGLVGVTDEILAYEVGRVSNSPVDNFVYPNGFPYQREHITEDRRTGCPRFLFVASRFAPWHGLDLLLQSAAACNEVFHVDIVGHVNAADRALAADDSRVRLHGHIELQGIRELAACADVGLSSFALHRQGMTQACTLKVRECLAMGLPVYSGHRDVFPGTFPYYMHRDCNMREMLDYARCMRSVPRQQVADTAKQYIDKQVLVGQLFRWLEQRVAHA